MIPLKLQLLVLLLLGGKGHFPCSHLGWARWETPAGQMRQMWNLRLKDSTLTHVLHVLTFESSPSSAPAFPVEASNKLTGVLDELEELQSSCATCASSTTA